MSKEQAVAFIEYIQADEELQQLLQQSADNLIAIRMFAAREGFDFTDEEWVLGAMEFSPRAEPLTNEEMRHIADGGDYGGLPNTVLPECCGQPDSCACSTNRCGTAPFRNGE